MHNVAKWEALLFWITSLSILYNNDHHLINITTTGWLRERAMPPTVGAAKDRPLNACSNVPNRSLRRSCAEILRHL